MDPSPPNSPSEPTPVGPEHAVIAMRWIAKADADLRMAHHALLLTDEDRPFDAAVFHAQQAVEKYVKGVLVRHGLDVPRTHDIRLLTRRLEERGVLPAGIDVDATRVLTRYAVDTRYPDDIEPVTRTEAEEALVLADAVAEAIHHIFMPDEPSRGNG